VLIVRNFISALATGAQAITSKEKINIIRCMNSWFVLQS